jgi:hypothetical protein
MTSGEEDAMAAIPWSFRGVVADGRGGVVVVAGRDDLTESNVPMSFVLHYQGHWRQKDVPFIANNVLHLRSETLVLGVYGYVLRWKGDDSDY